MAQRDFIRNEPGNSRLRQRQHAFGMEGVGTIYEHFASGELEDDDEVAVAHGSAEEGYLGLSIAMVDIRATLAAAEQQQIVVPATHAQLIRLAKALYYPDRFYPTILQQAKHEGARPSELESLRNWLPTGVIHQKRDDALAMLRRIRGLSDAGIEPKHVPYIVHQTHIWEAFSS